MTYIVRKLENSKTWSCIIMEPLAIKSVIALALCGSVLFTEIQGSTYHNSFFPLKQRFNSFPWDPPVSLLDFFRYPSHSIRGWRDSRDAFMKQRYHTADDDASNHVSRYRTSNCRHRDDDYQTQKMVTSSEQNQRDYMINQRSSDWNTRGRNQHSTSNNPHCQEQSSNKESNPQQFDRHPNIEPQENDVKRKGPHRSYQQQEPIHQFQRQPKVTNPPVRKQQPHSSRPSQPLKMEEIANLDVSGYFPDEITIEVKNNGQIIIKGLHVCDCEESCFEREFQRRVAIPKGINVRSLKAVFTPYSKLRIVGYHSQEQNTSDFKLPYYVSVESDESLWHSKQRNSDPTCGGQKRGIKLKQMDSKSKQIIEDHPEVRTDEQFEGEIDEDGVTIETDEY